MALMVGCYDVKLINHKGANVDLIDLNFEEDGIVKKINKHGDEYRVTVENKVGYKIVFNTTDKITFSVGDTIHVLHKIGDKLTYVTPYENRSVAHYKD
jgi:hypothetical protein